MRPMRKKGLGKVVAYEEWGWYNLENKRYGVLYNGSCCHITILKEEIMGYLYFAIGLAILALAGFFAWRNRKDTSSWIFCITIGIFFSTFFMVLPTEWIKEGKAVSYPTLYTLLSSLFYSFKTLGGRQEITQLETMPLTDPAKSIYIVFDYLVFIAAPVLTSSLLLSFLGDMGGKMQYCLRFPFISKCHVFSEINENSLALAKGIKNSPSRKTIVFCNTKKTDRDMLAQAKNLGAILLYKSCKDMKISRRFSQYEFYLISANEDNNIELTEAIIVKNRRLNKFKIIINAFVESGTNARFLESFAESNIGKSKDGQRPAIELRCIDEIALFCNYLVYQHPLYCTKNQGNHISVAIIGCGRTGMRMLKTVYWAGQIDGYTLKIRVYDKNTDKVQEKFYQQCPGLKGENAIRFVKTDVETLDFRENLLKEENSPDATYIVVAMGDDQLNFSTSDELFKIYRRNNGFDEENMPEIFARVRSNLKSQSYINENEFLTKRHIHLFGTAESVFSEKTLFNTELENLAFAVHLAYWGRLKEEKGSSAYEEAYLDFKTNEYNRRSSMATALHIPAKLHMCDNSADNMENIFSEAVTQNIKTYASRIQDSKELERLARNEHDRWNAFMLSEGYQSASKEEMLQYCKISKSHKDDLSMLHPCLTDWESLDDLSKTFNSACGKNKDFKSSDADIVRNIPEIIKKAKNMKGKK